MDSILDYVQRLHCDVRLVLRALALGRGGFVDYRVRLIR